MRKLNIPRSLLPALMIGSISLVFVLFQGGVITEAFREIFTRSAGQESFHTFTFALSCAIFCLCASWRSWFT